MDWQDLRVAYVVSQEKTVSGAAKQLGVHHATIIRHIDRLEQSLGQKLFRRHAKGYEATEAGQKLFNVAAVANEQFLQAEARIEDRDAEITGKIVVTLLPHFCWQIMPALAEFRRRYPHVRVRAEASLRLYRLEYGEAHIALRAGPKPNDPDNVAVELTEVALALYASKSYTEKHGMYDGSNPEGHHFIGLSDDDAPGPYNRWLREQNLIQKIALDTEDPVMVRGAVLSGIGLGFMPITEAENLDDLVCHMGPSEKWTSKIWQVTHRDMHRTPKIQAMSECLREFVEKPFATNSAPKIGPMV